MQFSSESSDVAKLLAGQRVGSLNDVMLIYVSDFFLYVNTGWHCHATFEEVVASHCAASDFESIVSIDIYHENVLYSPEE